MQDFLDGAKVSSTAKGQDLAGYTADLKSRFANPGLPHLLTKIAMDGSQKIPQRWLETLSYHQQHGRPCPARSAVGMDCLCAQRRANGRRPDGSNAGKRLGQARPGQNCRSAFGDRGVFASHYIADSDAMKTLGARVNARMQSAATRD